MGNSFFWLTAFIGLICGLVGWTLCHFWGWRTPEEQVVRRIVEESGGSEALEQDAANHPPEDHAKDAEIVRLQGLLASAPLPANQSTADATQARLDAAEAAAAQHLNVIAALQGELSMLAQPSLSPPVDEQPQPTSESLEAVVSGWSARVAELDALLARQHHEQEQAQATSAAQAEAAKAANDELRVELGGLQQRMIDLQSAHGETLTVVNDRWTASETDAAHLRTMVASLQSNGERAVSDWRTRYAALEAEVGRAREWEGRYRALETERDRMRADLEARYRALQSGIDVPAPDNLVVIEGIGPKISSALISAGITRFVDIRDADETRLRAAIKKAGIPFAPSVTTWAEQAGYLVDGDIDGFRRFVDRLSAGRRPSIRRTAAAVVDGAVIELPASDEVPAAIDATGPRHEDAQ